MNRSKIKDWASVAVLAIVVIAFFGINDSINLEEGMDKAVLGEKYESSLKTTNVFKTVETQNQESSALSVSDAVETENTEGFAFIELPYEYGLDGVRIDVDIFADFWPLTGTISYSKVDGESVNQNFSFHELDEVSSPIFYSESNDGMFSHGYTLGYITTPGRYDIDVSIQRGTTQSAVATFQIKLPTFDFYKGKLCSDDRVTFLTYSIFSLENLPSLVDNLVIETKGGPPALEVKNIEINIGSDKFGWIDIPINIREYKDNIEGKKLATSMTINRERVSKLVAYPILTGAEPTCERG